jgi:hypothetical protein
MSWLRSSGLSAGRRRQETGCETGQFAGRRTRKTGSQKIYWSGRRAAAEDNKLVRTLFEQKRIRANEPSDIPLRIVSVSGGNEHRI